jgi:hypothetical protein
MRILRFVFILILITHSAFAATAFRSGLDPHPKVLVLIIANDDKDYYLAEQKIWRSYMHLDREHVEAYFIKGTPDLEQPYLIFEDEILSKMTENYIPGILNKTILSMEAMLSRLDEFDYVLRTNLSSFYYFPKLLDFLKTLPPTKCYTASVGTHNGKSFGSGAGFILSIDLVKMLIDHKEKLLDNTSYPDDVVIGHFFTQRNIRIIPAKRLDFPSRSAFIKHRNRNLSKHYHFRLKHDQEHLRNTEEIYLQKTLTEMFYGVTQ